MCRFVLKYSLPVLVRRCIFTGGESEPVIALPVEVLLSRDDSASSFQHAIADQKMRSSRVGNARVYTRAKLEPSVAETQLYYAT